MSVVCVGMMLVTLAWRVAVLVVVALLQLQSCLLSSLESGEPAAVAARARRVRGREAVRSILRMVRRVVCRKGGPAAGLYYGAEMLFERLFHF